MSVYFDIVNAYIEEAVFAMVTPRTLQGDPVYELVDKMVYENGRLVTHSPPFPGADLLLHPPDAVKDAQDFASLVAVPKPATAGGPAIDLLGVMPMVLATKTQPVIFTGKVLEQDNNATTGQIEAVRPLAGALVNLSPTGRNPFGRPGRLAAAGSAPCRLSPWSC
jgi:hypothetical protein